MSSSIGDAKRELRLAMRDRLAVLAASHRVQAAAAARARLVRQGVWQGARLVLFFAPLPEEVDVWPLLPEALAAGKLAALPGFDPDTGAYVPCRILDDSSGLQAGRFGIREPKQPRERADLKAADLVLVPGVAFDRAGHRLGRGKGYYDRMLRAVAGTKCGVAFDEQIVDEVPTEAHDLRLDCLLTPARWFDFVGGGANPEV